jgi:serine/threonine protein kinase
LYPEGRSQEQMGRFAISQHNGQRNTQTGHLDRRTLLHKRYLIQRTVGQGGMGAVYQAKDIKRQSICAIKEMSLSLVPAEERARTIQNFKIEAKLLWGLNHPNLPTFHGFFTENQRYFLVMEYIDGHTLEELLERNGGPFTERRVLGWGRQLCDVLEYLHSHNPPIIYRDMKPGNIMLTRDGRIKLIDFGIARFFRSTSSQDTQLLGTPGFAPPEQYGKAQTDERSDIYSLAMTLFELLTDTLPETGFGLKDVRATNPNISPGVARALEKATALDPEERYENIAAFRRALLGVGTFIFENGDNATSPQELADLCARYPEEASDYLADGEIESWLHEIGEEELARAARHIRARIDDPLEAVEQFIRAVMGPNARLRSYSGQVPIVSQEEEAAPAGQTANRGGRGWFSPRPATPVQVSPRTLDFGPVYPGISAPLVISISGDQGTFVSGTIQAVEPWILIDQNRFDGMSAHVNVRINSTQLSSSTHYSGSILITPDSNGGKRDIVVTVEADVLEYARQNNFQRRGGKTVGANLDDDFDDDEDALTMGSLTMVPPTVQATLAETGLPPTVSKRHIEYRTKYGQPGGTASGGWDPVQITARQRLWLQRILAIVAAFMAASLSYTIFSQLSLLGRASPLPPNPVFALVLAGMVPLAALGASLVNNSPGEWLDRICTGMGGVLLSLGVVKVIWQILLHASLAPLQLVLMLLVAAISAVIGTHATINGHLIYGISWVLARSRRFTLTLAVVMGGSLGFLLTIDAIPNWTTPIGIALGIGVGLALALRVDHLMKNQP